MYLLINKELREEEEEEYKIKFKELIKKHKN